MLSELLYLRHRRILSAPMSVRLDESPGWSQLADICLSAAEKLDCEGVTCLSVGRVESRLALTWHFEAEARDRRAAFEEIGNWSKLASSRLCWGCGERYGDDCDLHRWRI